MESKKEKSSNRLNRIKDLFKSNEYTDSFKESKKYASDDDINILLTGETGTGKEVHARYIHSISPRKDRPFIVANFSAIPESLTDSILFGHVKGSFTGAIDQVGLFKEANGGTIFLDEIGDANLKVQSSILRVIDYGEILTVGKQNSEEVDVRIIAASNINFQEKIDLKEFRKDLYYRLKGAEIHLKPLRMFPTSERLNILQKLIADSAKHKNRKEFIFSDSAWDVLLNYKYPGNYREARNIIESLFTLNKEIIEITDLPDLLLTFPTEPSYATEEKNTFDLIIEKSKKSPTLEDKVAYIVYDIVKKHNGIVKYAAHELGIDIKTVKKYLKHYYNMGNFSGKIPTGDSKISEEKNENE